MDTTHGAHLRLASTLWGGLAGGSCRPLSTSEATAPFGAARRRGAWSVWHHQGCPISALTPTTMMRRPRLVLLSAEEACSTPRWCFPAPPPLWFHAVDRACWWQQQPFIYRQGAAPLSWRGALQFHAVAVVCW